MYAILYRPFGVLSYLTLSVLDEGYSRNAPRALNIWIRCYSVNVDNKAYLDICSYTVNIDNKTYLDICCFKLTLTYVILNLP
jgi:hypothetical protein